MSNLSTAATDLNTALTDTYAAFKRMVRSFRAFDALAREYPPPSADAG